jgi:hypothetical protein
MSVGGGALRVRVAYGESVQPFELFDLLPLPPVASPFIPGLEPTIDLPERMKELEGGVDLAWGRRASVSATVYRRQIDNVLVFAPGVTLFGGGAFAVNRDVDTRGVELDARAAVVERSSWRWELRAIAAALRSRAGSGFPVTTSGSASLQEGSPVFGVPGGDATYSDANGDGLLSRTEFKPREWNTDLRPSTPTFEGALHSTITWRSRLTLLAIVDRHSGHHAFPGSEAMHCGQPNCREAQDPSATLAEQARALELQSGRAFTDASFTRLREVALRWVLAPARADASPFRGATIVVAGRDLATWTGWRGLDPEINTNLRSALLQSDRGGVPLPRRVSIGLEIDAGGR